MTDNKWIKALLWILLLFLYILLNGLFANIIKSFDIKNDLLLNIVYIIAEIIIAGILIYLYRKDFKDKFKELKSSEGNQKIVSSIKAWLIGLLFMVISNIVLSILIKDIAENEAISRDIISNTYIYALVSMVFLAPICEEIIFRLSISKIFDNKYLYVIFSGLIFGFVHVMGSTGLQALYILPYSSIGFAFAYTYNKNQNILCSILTHSLHNLTCLLIILL